MRDLLSNVILGNIILSIVIIVICFILAIILGSLKVSLPQNKRNPYSVRENFLTDNERAFLKEFNKACGPEFTIFAQVRLADILNPVKEYKDLNKVASKSIDFIVCKSEDLSLVCAVELDDSTHKLYKRRQRDKFVDDLFQMAKFPLIRFQARSNYNANNIRRLLPFCNPPVIASRVD